MRLIAITGATGFVGRALVLEARRRGWQLREGVRRATSSDQFEYGDLAGDVDWSRFVDGASVVVHLAGIAHTEGIADSSYDRVNHQQSAALAIAAHAARTQRLVFVSSVRAQIGPVAVGVLDEQVAPRPTDAYGRSKLAAEYAVLASGVPCSILRPVLIYGQGVKGNLAALERIARLPVPLPFGSMTNRRSLCSVDGLIDAIDLVASDERACGETFLVADRVPIELRELIAALRRGVGRRPALIPVPPRMLRMLLRVAGRATMWERLGGELAVSSARLAALGWRPRDTATELARGLS